ncbi:O-antigen ligase family protein [Amnibacterium sp.]|uniref:O-antigen ligase family protein n=1 Tax=Amnibacterium sp. TaxID=1872496 RepID=UPI003F7CB061
MNIVMYIGGGAIGLLLLAALWAAKSWKPTLWALAVLLSVSPLALATKVPALGSDTLFKAAIMAMIVLLWMRLGMRVRWPVGLMLGALLFALIVSVTHVVPSISVSTGLAFKAFSGYFITIAALMVRWRREHLADVLQVLVALPLLSNIIGLVLQAAGMWQIRGDGRLGGALIGPTLALLSVSAAFAALAGIMVLGRRKWTVWLLVDCAFAFLTLTRGALLASGILVLAMGIWTFRARRTSSSKTVNAARLVFFGAVAVALIALPSILARDQGNSYEGSFNTSGRDQAWPFYISLSANSPLLGRGLGFANIANALLHPVGVQSAFESPHNEYIHLYVDGGFVLAVPFFFGLIALFALVGRITRRRMLALGILGATLLYCYVDNNFSTPQFDVVLGLLLAALMAPAPTSDEAVELEGRAIEVVAEREQSDRRPVRV